jgi:hypothetical protein
VQGSHDSVGIGFQNLVCGPRQNRQRALCFGLDQEMVFRESFDLLLERLGQMSASEDAKALPANERQEALDRIDNERGPIAERQ